MIITVVRKRFSTQGEKNYQCSEKISDYTAMTLVFGNILYENWLFRKI